MTFADFSHRIFDACHFHVRREISPGNARIFHAHRRRIYSPAIPDSVLGLGVERRLALAQAA
jgi:hypothetical protein